MPADAADKTASQAYKAADKGAAGKTSDKTWLIDQQDQVGGVHTIYASTKGIRIESKQSKVVIVASPPTWKVATYSDPKRMYFDCPAEKFVNILSKPIAVLYGVNLTVIPLKKSKVVTKCGAEAVAYDTPFNLGIKEFWNTPVNEIGTHRLPMTAHAEFAESLKLPEPEGTILIRLYGVPKEPGLPLVFEYRDQDKDLHRHLKTFTVKEIKVDESKFKVPAGYQRVSTAEEVVRAVDTEDVQNLF